jgi:SPP1 gp7 family putative phage head morphogenesis protein
MTGGKSVKTKIKSNSLERLSAKALKENVKIISSIPDKYLIALKKSAYEVADGKGTLEELDNRLSKRRGQSKRYINNVAFGQTEKIFNNSNSVKMKDIGLHFFKWIYTFRAITPRHNHVEMNGNIYRIDNPPVIEEDGRTGFPGDAPGCHCLMAPVVGNFE